jgi:hypothetical protein
VQQQQQQPGDQQEIPEELLYKPTIDPEMYEESLVNDLQGMSKHQAQMVARLQQEHLRLADAFQQQQQAMQQMLYQQRQDAQAREQERFDEAVRNLGPEWENVFGKEHFQELPFNSPQMRNRVTALQAARQLQWIKAQQGQPMSLADVLPSSVQLAFPKQEHHSKGQPRSKRGRFLARPSSSRTGSPSTKKEQQEKAYSRWDDLQIAEEGLSF